MLVFVLVSEHDLGEGSTSTGVVDNVSHDSLDVAKNGLERVAQGAFANIGQFAGAFEGWFTYPDLSAKSRVLKRAGATLLQVCALKTADEP